MIGYYIHHQGDGHVSRATAVALELSRHETVTGLSSRPRPPDWIGPWIRLAPDDDPAATSATDPTASGALHWAPTRHDGLRERMARIAGWVQRHRPRLVVVDVSVEVCLLVRTMGVPVVVVGMPGTRDDPPHQLAFRIASAIITPWPAWADPMTGAEDWTAKTHAVGAMSRFDQRAVSRGRCDPSDGRRRVLVLSGRGGTQLDIAAIAAAQRATPDWAWTILGPPGGRWIDDPWSLLCAADVVVTHAGQNAIADVAAARRPAIVIPQPRPHDEQRATAQVLERAGLAIVEPVWAQPDRWPALLAAADRLGGMRWERWSSGRGARRAAAAIRGAGLPAHASADAACA
ncbi:UDP-N-acetylglucosamine--N-acetylmuramyl-(pentapeptide) pyrophosphoryl-undecaprenol N-acetylglucosamine transferase [Baekduia soli]|uniref:UDP-N-acetylglucosamine--N-acetylmuramyl-(Pentapeptide) pyrophosphoryl-undecaprenol N-acetylglucosamine transferase n=1 Tax=Baekduia soli TaxID=496014 RepID=A0A5B8U477_9ACTN|nr:glycosyltransferase [Baekduia soli]QEC47909.1 UDP-N-acetylglucosamine--N-acetylmuramyl-(pentapeptide) pyrophosphoryl-undecaprenol N-acetylglucosamine transferase [Baekduia soli]